MVFPLIDDMEISENGVLSFENPNYVLRHTFADTLNSNSASDTIANYQSTILSTDALANNTTTKNTTTSDSSNNIADNLSNAVNNANADIVAGNEQFEVNDNLLALGSLGTDEKDCFTGPHTDADLSNCNDSSRKLTDFNINSQQASDQNTKNFAARESAADFASLDGGLAALDSLCSSLEQVCELSRSSSHRRRYAQLRPDSMGVDLQQGPVTNLDNSEKETLLNEKNQQQPKQHQQQEQHGYRISRSKALSTAPVSSTVVSYEDDRKYIVMGRYDNLDTNKPDLIEDVARRQQQQFLNNQADENQLKDPDIHHKDQFVDLDNKKEEEREEDQDCSKDVVQLKDSGNDKGTRMLESGTGGDGADGTGGGIPHIAAGEGQELYALPVKGPRPGDSGADGNTTQQHSGSFSSNTSNTSSSTSGGSAAADSLEVLPPGWERHEDNDGPYYWHIKSGTITRTAPAPATRHPHPHPPPPAAHRRSKDEQVGVPRSTTSSALAELAELRPRSTNTAENAYKRRSYPVRSELSEAGCGRAVRFAVRSLGWLEVPEEELTPERSSKAVNRCIVDLSMGRRDVMDVVGCWGEGKDLFMDLDEGSLKLVDPENLTLLNSQPIHTIRVWGVGRDNGRERDFAYVARDRVSRKHMCHVFRCDTPARTIANTLRDICKKIMIERSLNQSASKGDLGSHMGSSNSLAGNNNNNNNTMSPLGRAARPCNLPTEHRRLQRHNSLLQGQSFPTPMEEPRKVVKAEFVGSLQVSRPSGMEVVNRAIQDAVNNNPGPWDPVMVAVAPSTITVTDAKDNSLITECRVRFLSFLGIGRNVHHCAFIMHNAQDQFVAHVFFCEPSSGALCKTIEAACKLRYQKCLDAHPTVGGGSVGAGGRGGDQRGGVAATLRNVLTSLAGVRGKKMASS